MFYMSYRDDEEEEKDDENAAIADDALEEIGADFVEDEIGTDAEVPKILAEDDDEEDVDYDKHDDVDPI